MTFIIADNVFGFSGYSKCMRELGFAMKRRGVDVQIPWYGSGGYLPEKLYDLISYTPLKLSKDDTVYTRVYFNNPLSYALQARIIGGIVLESTRYPERAIKEINDDRIVQTWTASKHCKLYLEESGAIREKVKVVPHGYDPEVFRFQDKRSGTGPFRFLFVGGYMGRGDRKGADILVRSFIRAFPNNPDVELYLKLNPSYALGAPELAVNPRIKIDVRQLTDSQMAEVYNSADSFVNPSLGEGFNMALLEAMVTGLPSISSNFGGQMDYIDETGIFYTLLTTPKLVPKFTLWDVGYWGYYDENDLVQSLIDLYNSNPHRVRYKAATALTWDNAAKIAIGLLEELDGR